MINKLLSITHSVVREHIIKKIKRSSEWRKIRKEFLMTHPVCAVCNSKRLLQVHHCIPFNENPALELDQNNLIVLCMGLKLCHLKIGHGGSFKSFSPTVKEDAFILSKDLTKFNSIAILAEQNRVPNDPTDSISYS